MYESGVVKSIKAALQLPDNYTIESTNSPSVGDIEITFIDKKLGSGSKICVTVDFTYKANSIEGLKTGESQRIVSNLGDKITTKFLTYKSYSCKIW